MNTLAEWIALHSLLLWALLLLLALLAGDLAWRHNARWQRRAALLGQAPTMLRWRTGLLLCMVLGLFFGGLALATHKVSPRWVMAASWSVALLGILPINGGLKALFRRARPMHDHGFIVEPGWSFPSGHAFGAMVFYGMLAYVLLRLTPRFHRAVIAGAVLMVGVIGVSRILLQVHYLSDVMAGYAIGAAWLVLCMGTSKWLRHQPGGATP